MQIVARRATAIAPKALIISVLADPPLCAAAVSVVPVVDSTALKIVPVNVCPLIVVVTAAPRERLALPVVVADTLDGEVTIVTAASVVVEQLSSSSSLNPDQLTTQSPQFPVKVVHEQWPSRPIP